MDAVAVALDLDPAEVRRRNLIKRTRFPFTTGSGTRYDSGNYEAALDRSSIGRATTTSAVRAAISATAGSAPASPSPSIPRRPTWGT